MAYDPLDPFGLKKKASPKDSREGVFSKSSGGGASGKSRERAAAKESEEAENADYMQEDKVKDPPPDSKPKVVLSNPKWGATERAFDESVNASVQGSLPEESQHITRVSFTLFATSPAGKQERVEAKDGHIDEGKASVEFKLSHPQFKDANGDKVPKCGFIFTAKHRDSDVLESETLSVTAANEKDAHKSSHASKNEIHIEFDPAKSKKS